MKSSLTPSCCRSRVFFPAVIIFLFSFFLFSSPLRAKTTIDDSALTALGISLPDKASWEDSFENVVDDNGPAYANAFAFASTLGYTIGKANIGTFPSFEVGVSLSSGLTNMRNFQKTNTGVYNGTVPGIGLSPCFHFGIGLANGIDFVGKFLTFNQDIYKIPVPDNRYFNLDEFSQYALGGKVRFNYVKEKTVIPFLLNFGGITFSVGGDFMRGKYAIRGQYSYDFPTQQVELTAAPGVPIDVTPAFDGDYRAAMSWYQLSATTQAIAYFDVMYLFSIYTGFGATFGYGWFSFDFDATGDLTDKSGYLAASPYGSSNIGQASFKSTNKYNPDVFLPTYILGLELNIGFVKIGFESQVNLKNREDVSASFGVRAQF